MFDKPVTPSASSSEDLLDARKKFEAEKLTRRSALKKFGITSGMAVFGMFAADDLARMVIKKMEENEATRQIAETVAHEFKNSGIAFASPPNRPPLPGGCAKNVQNPPKHDSCCTGAIVGYWCNGYATFSDCTHCCNGVYSTGGFCNDVGTALDNSDCNAACRGGGNSPGE